MVAGRDTAAGKSRHPTGATPDTLRVLHLMPRTSSYVKWEVRDESLRPDMLGHWPWLEHPAHGRQVDVVALPLKNAEGVELHPYDVDKANHLRAGVSEMVNIVGFPFGKSAGGAFGVWVKGAIASEPDVDFGDLPCFLVDARTRPGQSGSPVIAFSTGPHHMTGGALAFGAGPITEFLGVYSARIHETSSDLGLVWKREAIAEILSDGVPGNGRESPC